MRQRRSSPMGDGGSATVWVLGCAALLALVTAVAVLRGAAVLARHRAEGTADLAALAAAAHIGLDQAGCAAAADIAAANGARVQSCVLSQGADARSGAVVVRVVMPVRLPGVAIGSVSASARAGRGVSPALPPAAPLARGRSVGTVGLTVRLTPHGAPRRGRGGRAPGRAG